MTSTTVDALPANAREFLHRYRNLLLSWNNRFNLTAITEPAEVDRRLIGDALRMLPALDDAITRARAETTETIRTRLLDVGSGAGLPGLVLAIARPEIEVTLMDATGKKVGFLQHVIDDLGLQRARAIHSRAEDAARDLDLRGQFDIVTARAVAALPTLLELCIPFLRRGGYAILPKGDAIERELFEGRRAADTLGARIVSSDLLPADEGDAVTRLVIATKIASTPDRYPRRSGVPNKEPLGRAHP